MKGITPIVTPTSARRYACGTMTENCAHNIIILIRLMEENESAGQNLSQGLGLGGSPSIFNAAYAPGSCLWGKPLGPRFQRLTCTINLVEK